MAFAFLLPQNIFAADPDLSNYTVIKTFDFKNGFTDNTTLTQGDATGTKSYDTGNKKDQDLYNVQPLKNWPEFWLYKLSATVPARAGGCATVSAYIHIKQEDVPL